MENFDIFDLKNTAADPRREAIAMSAGQLVSQGGTLYDIWQPWNGTAKYEFDSAWDDGIAITVTGMWPTRGNSVEQPRIGVRLAKQTKLHFFDQSPELQYGLRIAQTFNNDAELVETIVAPLHSRGFSKKRQQRQSARGMAERLVSDFPVIDTAPSTLWQPLSLER